MVALDTGHSPLGSNYLDTHMKTSESIAALADALAKAQGAMKNAAFNKMNPHFKKKYADLSSVREATIKPLNDNGLSIMQVVTTEESGAPVLISRLMHKSGEWIEASYPLPITPLKPQELGSAITYARRYSWASLCGIAADDDDDAELGNNSTTLGQAKISQEQCDWLLTLMEQYGADQKAFEKYMKVENIADLPASRYDEAIKALEIKGRRR